MANERYDVEMGLQFVPGQAAEQMGAEIKRILREAQAAAASGGGILDVHTADAFGERLGAAMHRGASGLLDPRQAEEFAAKLGAELRQHVEASLRSGGTFNLLDSHTQSRLTGLAIPPNIDQFIKSQLAVSTADRNREMVGLNALRTDYGSKKLVEQVLPTSQERYQTKAYPDEARAQDAVEKAERAYAAAVGTANAERKKFMDELSGAERKEQEALAQSTMAIQRNTDRSNAAEERRLNALGTQINAINTRTDKSRAAEAAEAERVAKLADARIAADYPVSFPSAASHPNTKVGAAQESVNIAERNVAIALNRRADIARRLADADGKVTPEEVFRAGNGLDAARRNEIRARNTLTQEERRAAELLKKNNEGQLGVVGQFKQGFVGVADKPFTEQIGQAFKFSVFYGTAYKALFALTQTFQQTLQEGIAFENQVTELKLATGQSAEAAQDLANQIGREASQYGFAPSDAVAVAARAQGYYGTTGLAGTAEGRATQADVGAVSARVADQLAFGSGKQPADIQANLAAITQAYGLGYQSQTYIGDLDAYFSRRFGAAPGETIGAVAQAGTVGRAAGFAPAEVSAIAADIIARTGASDSQAGGFLAQIFSRSGEGSLTKLTSRYGIEGGTLADQFKQLAKVYQSQPEQRDDIAAAFGRGKVQNAVISLLQDYPEVLKAAGEANKEAPGALAAQTNLRLSDIGGQIQAFVGTLRQFANDLGQTGLLDDLGIMAITVKNLVEAGDDLLQLFNLLPRPLKDIAFAAGAAAAALKLGRVVSKSEEAGGLLGMLAPRSRKAAEEVAADVSRSTVAADVAASAAAVDLKAARNKALAGVAAEEGRAYRVVSGAGFADMLATGGVRANPNKVRNGYDFPYFGEAPLERYAPRGGAPAYVISTAGENVEKSGNGFLGPAGGAAALSADDVVVHRVQDGESKIVHAGANTGAQVDPQAAVDAAKEAVASAEARAASLQAEVVAAREATVATEQETVALAAQSAVAQANVQALDSMAAQSAAAWEEQYAIYGASGEMQAELSALYAKSTAAAEQLVVAQAAATEASERHAAAVLTQVEAEALLERAQASADVSANAAAASQERLAVAEAEVAAAGPAAATGMLSGVAGGIARWGPLAAVAALGFGDLKLNDANKKLNAAHGDFNKTIADSGDVDLTTPEGLSARSSTLAAQEQASRDAAHGLFAHLIDLGSKRQDALSDADWAKQEKERLAAAATLVQQHQDALTAGTPGAAITGFDSDSLSQSLQAITQSGGTAKTQFDALASSLDSAGRAANRAASFDPQVFAATAEEPIFQALIKHPGFVSQSSPSGAGELVNNFLHGASFTLADGPIKKKDNTEDLIRAGINPADIQKRLYDQLLKVGDPGNLSPDQLGAVASSVVGDLPDKVGKKEGFGTAEVKKLRSELIETVTAALQDLAAGTGGLAKEIQLTADQSTATVDLLVQSSQGALSLIPATDFKGRTAQNRQLLQRIRQTIAQTQGGATPEDLAQLAAARRALAETQFDQLEAERKAAQQNAHSAAGVAAAGHAAEVQEIRAAVAGRDPDLLAKIISQAGKESITIARQAIRQALAAARAAEAIRVAAANIIGPGLDDTGHGGSYAAATTDPAVEALNGMAAGLANDVTAGPGANVYNSGSDVAGAAVGSPAERAAAAAQADAIRKQGQIAKARADIVAAHAAMDAAKGGSVEYYNALGQLYQAQQELAQAVVAYKQNLYLLGHDITDPLVQARAAARAAAATLRNDKGSGAAADQIASDKVALEQAQASAESTAFQQRLSAVQTADELGRISHQKYLNYLQHEHDRLEAVKHRTFQQQQELDQVDQLLKSANDALQGQWNFGDIKLPTPYEVQRRVQEIYGNAGNKGAGSDAFLPTNALGQIHGVTNNNNVYINGAEIGAIRKVLHELLGDRATTSTTAARHR